MTRLSSLLAAKLSVIERAFVCVTLIISGALVDNSNELHPVAEILDNLKNDDLALRLGALRRLTTIALALGPERTTNDLLPFLAGLAGDEEDEVLLVLGEELPKLISYGTDGAKSAQHLLPILEVLLQAEETVVRQQVRVCLQGKGSVLLLC
jgi:serine/threonine-protein phosphatase 2A regulatory subunit A